MSGTDGRLMEQPGPIEIVESPRPDGPDEELVAMLRHLEECEDCPDRAERLHPYESGTWGPEPAQPWMKLIVGNR